MLYMSDKPYKNVFRDPSSNFMVENRKLRTIFYFPWQQIPFFRLQI